MTDAWYAEVKPETPITQGDLILNCPVVGWAATEIHLQGKDEKEVLKGVTKVFQADLLVMTQACDLEQHRVDKVILCPHHTLDEHKAAWTQDMTAKNQNPTAKAWVRYLDDICNGFLPDLAMLNSGGDGTTTVELRVVEFSEVYTLPRAFIESLLVARGKPRLRLLPPYREHISQSFARFFMRVGLPAEIKL